MLTRLSRLLLALVISTALLTVLSAGAQSVSGVKLYPLDKSQFPSLSAYLDVRDDGGRFLPDLTAEDLRILENNISLPLDNLVLLNPGTQFVVAIAPGASLSLRDGLGRTRYDYIAEHLTAWAQGLPSPTEDDLSLLIDGGPTIAHTRSADEWINALQSFQAESREDASLQILSAALDLAEDPTDDEGMSRAILFITSPLVAGSDVGLPNLIARADELGVRIFVWFVAAPEFFSSPSSALMQDLAAQTGGEFNTYPSESGLPDLEGFLAPLRSVYRLVYTSQVKASGSYPVAVEINTLALQTVSSPRDFEIEVLPPNPIFSSPPGEIQRMKVEISGPGGEQPIPVSGQDLFTPAEQPIVVVIEFPDGHLRSIITSTLYVDNQIAAQNSAAPFDSFTWDLTTYTQSGSHSLRVEVIDQLGLTGKTFDFPVNVVVEQPAINVRAVLTGQGLWIVGGIVVVAGGVLVLVLILGGRIQPQLPGQKYARRKKGRAAPASAPFDPLTQSIAALPESESRWAHWLRRREKTSPSAADAFLQPLSDDDGASAAPIVLAAGELTIGRSPAHAEIILDDPSIADLHARVLREGDQFRIQDQGSVAGTWINYQPISQEGVILAHGDVVHIGRKRLRFRFRKPVQVRKPMVSLQEEIQ